MGSCGLPRGWKGIALAAAYLAMVALALASSRAPLAAPEGTLFQYLSFFLAADFLAGLASLRAPAELAGGRPAYVGSPIARYTLPPASLAWLGLTVPYSILAVLPSGGLARALGLVVSFQLAITANAQWRMAARALIARDTRWWALPLAAYGALFSPIAYPGGLDLLLVTSARIGEGLAAWDPLPWLCLLAILAALCAGNRALQRRLAVTGNATGNPGILGSAGRRILLEAGRLAGNRHRRKAFAACTAAMAALGLALCLAGAHGAGPESACWLPYAFIAYGYVLTAGATATGESRADGTADSGEGDPCSLRARYRFHAALLAVPFLLLVPTAIAGRPTILELSSAACFTAGPAYWMLARMSARGRGPVAGGAIAMLSSAAAAAALQILLGESAASMAMLLLGLAFIATHGRWLGRIPAA